LEKLLQLALLLVCNFTTRPLFETCHSNLRDVGLVAGCVSAEVWQYGGWKLAWSISWIPNSLCHCK